MAPIAQPQLFRGRGILAPTGRGQECRLPQPVLSNKRGLSWAPFVGTLMVSSHYDRSRPGFHATKKFPSTGGAGGGYQKFPLLRRGKVGTLHPALFLVGEFHHADRQRHGQKRVSGLGARRSSAFRPRKNPRLQRGSWADAAAAPTIEEGLWDKILDRLQPGDFILLQFGHKRFLQTHRTIPTAPQSPEWAMK